MKQVSYSSLLALMLLSLFIVAELAVSDRFDLIGKALSTGLPRVILPLIIVTLITHLITVKTRLIASTTFMARLIAGVVLLALAVAAFTLFEKFPLLDDLILAVAFFACIMVSYSMVNKLMLARS
ncbi:hypothetical protein [Pontibacter vulgaris]|uniref:hypothetical protein n=1 Tax=Pontibacter vulgaris TaxID=2905679 RepID=UPI001FA6E5D8|nr:hypothetical protein [Pontibacter vulgaris]